MRLLTCTLALALASTAALAQSFTPVREQKNLSPAAIAKLHTLETFNALPSGKWRFHAGDIPHGESPTLDDSSWAVVEPKSKAPFDAAWYRREITVPKTLNGYDITGARIWFQFHAGANGPMPQIIYFNGKRVALGDDLEPIVLFEPAKPGDKILVAVKLLRTVDEKTFNGVNMRIDRDPGGAATSNRPSPEDIRIQAITAANILPALATPRKDLLPKVEEAIAAIDTKALNTENQAAFDASLRKSQAILATLQPVLSQATLNLTGNSHIDAAWLWPASETVDAVHRTFTTALQLMNEYPDYTFTQSAAQYSEWMADKYPELNKQIKQRIKEGRWEIVGGMWVEPDLNIPDGESLVRQLLVGQRYFKKEFDVTARIGWNPDSFGYNWQLPQIYKRSGLDYFVTQKMHWNDTNQLPFRLFWWESPDGSKVLTYFPTDYVHSNVTPTRISADFAESAQRNPGTTEHMDLYGIGDHGGGPTRAMLDEADHWIAANHASTSGAPSSTTASSSSKVGSSGKSEAYAMPVIRYHTAQQYFTDVEGKLSADSPTWNYDSIAKGYTYPQPSAKGLIGLPTWKDELYFEYHRGIMTSQAQHKRDNRRTEVATLDAEKLASFAWLNGRTYPADAITDSWKKITFNQFHDLAAGSGIAVIYRDAQKDYTEVFHSDREIVDGSVATLSANVDTRVKNGVPVLVMNPSAWSRTGTTKLSVQLPDAAETLELFDNGKPVLTQVLGQTAGTHSFDVLAQVSDVPALGYKVFEARKAEPKNLAKIASDLLVADDPGAITLSNGKLKVKVDRATGCITSLQVLGGAETIAAGGCGNQLQTWKDLPKQYDAWNIDPGTLDAAMTPITQVDSVSVVDKGPLRATVRVARTWQSSKFVQDISLDAGADAVSVANDINWQEAHVLLKASFPLAATSGKASYEIPYGSIDRPTTRNNSWEKAQFEVPALRWADLGDSKQGVSILNDSKYGYDAVGNQLRLTLLRAPTWPDPDADRGRQRFTYAIYPHNGTWKQSLTVRHGYELNDPMSSQQVFAHTGAMPSAHSWSSVENPNVVLTAVKKAEDSDSLVFRMYEWAGDNSSVKLHVPAGATYAIESNLMEKTEGPHLPLAGDVVTVPIKPYEILTVQVAYPTPVK